MADTGSWVDKTVDNRYKVLEKIGQGGFGEVYKARHLRMDRTVALKLLRVQLAGDVEHLKRFEQEAKAASRINHPNAVVVYDSGQAEEGVLYIAMEYVDGVSLKHVLKEAKTLPPERVVRIIKQICSALAEAHRMGVVHRDLKPENIMICSKAGKEDVVKVLDFGIAKIISEDAQGLTQTGVAFGTPRYMSPEQCEGKPVDWRADIYALGCIIYEMLSGRPPFEGEVTTVMFKHVTEEPRPLREVTIKFDSVTEELEKVVFQALQKQRENRQSAEELARELEHAITIKVPTDQIPQAPSPPPSRPLPPPPAPPPPPPPPPIQVQV
ncbi:MAG: serine/threonine protein kinase, partial [Acidobacteria bacterium]|nr:serine/threonine protein kinase [Acidobacteriota bacterium]